MQKVYGKEVAIRMLVTVGSRDSFFFNIMSKFNPANYHKMKHLINH